ncbi:DUF4199 domain-containing protein [Rhodohalobacter sp. 614A]|uniref:DUF4199 domain-containing protein n=1 Tax=Rhodohalobacter sp. 614A TaxID=2908649 RepID=UPI001F263D54|nr:DUF4199 domain-containing protein [Rhodohalobacter sp. 614A]
MNEDENNQPLSFSDYLPSVGIVGAIFSLVSFVIGLFFGYQQINAEPTGSFFSPMMLSGTVVCLVSAFAGMIAVWHFTKEVTPYLTLGQGALIGFLTGAVIVIVSVFLNELWIMVFDPEYTTKIMDATIANIEAMEMPEESKQQMIDAMADSMGTSQSFWRQIFWGVPVTGLMNLITALIGVKIFGEKKEETF